MKTEINLNSDFAFTNLEQLENIVTVNNKLKICCDTQDEASEVKFSFELSDSGISELAYAFYGREFLLSKEKCHLKCNYGFMYPFSMITFLSTQKGVTLIANNAEITYIELMKNDSECYFTFGFSCEEKGVIEIIKNTHSNDYLEGIQAYRNWYIKKFGKLPQSNNDIKNAFHIRRYFFNRKLCSSHILDNDNVCLDEIYQDDCKQFGGVDVGLLFDFAYNESTDIRCGNITPISFGENQKNKLQKQIQQIKKEHQCKFFCYFDPYLIQDNSELDTLYRSSLPILTKDKSFCRVWGDKQWAPCIHEKLWQKFSAEYIYIAANALCCDGVYLDEFGNGTQYQCHNENHSHREGFSQIQTESSYHKRLMESIPDKLWMCEFPPADFSENSFDIVLSDTRTLINIYRFIFPELKFVRIIGCDRPLGNNEWDINKSFFNGEGLWLDNNANDTNWYPENMKQVIREQYAILKEYSKFFTSSNAEALFYTTDNGVLFNKFGYKGMAVLTFINPTDNDICMEMQFENFEPVKNLYKKTSLQCTTDKKFLLEIKKKSVGCALFRMLDQHSN